MSGSYKINGTEFLLQPTYGKWVPRESIGVDGSGHQVYAGVRDFEVGFQLTDPSHIGQLQNWYMSVGTTGTVVVDLPKYPVNSSDFYIFHSYSGCILQEPTMDAYFNEHHTTVVMIINNIRT